MNDKQKREFFRKTIHVSALILPLSYRYLFHNDRKLAFIVLVPLTLIALVIEIARIEHKTVKRIFLDFFGLMLREHEFHDFTGATYMMISTLICIAVFPADIAFVAIAFLAIGDTLAALVGIPFGKRKLLGTNKSLEGSMACFIGTFIFALFFLNPFIALAGAVAATIAEIFPLPVDDNIKIPISAGIVMSLVNLIF